MPRQTPCVATHHHTSPAAPPSGGDLARLLETEARLAAELGRAREEATRLVMAARADAAAREAALAADLETASRQLEATVEAERERRHREIAEGAAREAERFDRVGPEQVAALARYVLGCVIEGGTGAGHDH